MTMSAALAERRRRLGMPWSTPGELLRLGIHHFTFDSRSGVWARGCTGPSASHLPIACNARSGGAIQVYIARGRSGIPVMLPTLCTESRPGEESRRLEPAHDTTPTRILHDSIRRGPRKPRRARVGHLQRDHDDHHTKQGARQRQPPCPHSVPRFLRSARPRLEETSQVRTSTALPGPHRLP